MPAVCHYLGERAICISTSKLVHKGLIIRRTRPGEASVRSNLEFGLLFLCSQLMKLQAACASGALIIGNLLCNAECQQAKTPKSLR